VTGPPMGFKLEPWNVLVPDGTYLSVSRDSTGAMRALLRNSVTHELMGPPELFPIDSDNRGGMSPEAAALVSELIAVVLVATGQAVVEVASPYVAAGWVKTAPSGCRSVYCSCDAAEGAV
jgi:hypothetical protein